MVLRDFNPRDLQRLQELAARMQGSKVSQEFFDSSREEVFRGPEVYIARVTTPLPAIAQFSGTATGSQDWDTPGSAVLPFYRISSSGVTEPIGISRTVYNLSSVAISEEWVPVVRTKGGVWVTYCCSEITSGVCNACEDGTYPPNCGGENCSNFNTTFRVPILSVVDNCAGYRLELEPLDFCGYEDLVIIFAPDDLEEPTQVIIQVAFRRLSAPQYGFTFQKTFSPLPDCQFVSEDIPYLSSSQVACDALSATCTLDAV
jgi:hypothetical protein